MFPPQHRPYSGMALSPQGAVIAQLAGIGSTLLVALLVLVACNGATPTLYGKPIQDKTVANATKAIHIAEVGAATGVRVLTAGIASGVIKPEVGDVFITQIDPKVKAAIAGVKAVLKIMEASPSDTTTEKVLEATLVLQDVLVMVQTYLIDPAKWVATQGALP